MDIQRRDAVFVLTLGETENRFNDDFVTDFSACLDEVDAAVGPRSLVTTATGKFWSNGLDLDWMTSSGTPFDPFVSRVQGVFGRLLTAGFPTVAAIQGHAYAAGAMLALTHDVRIMREDRGFLCLPEVDIHIPFTPGMSSLISAKLSPPVAHQAMVFGRRFTGADALAAGIVNEIAAEGAVLDRAVEYAAAVADKDATTIATIKRTLYADTLALLT